MNNLSTNDHGSKVANMFAKIAGPYDRLNHILSFGIDYYWRNILTNNIKKDSNIILDLAAGTMDVSINLQKKYTSSQILALDFCLPMLQHGQYKLKKIAQNKIYPAVADAKKLPLSDGSIDSITIAFGIRNILPRIQAFKEMIRVLRRGGIACILEFGSGKEKIWGGIYNFYLKYILPKIGSLLSDKTAYDYLMQTIMSFPTANELEQEMLDAGFSKVWHKKITSGIVCLHIGEKA